MPTKIFFFQLKSLRDRQLDTVYSYKSETVVNRDYFQGLSAYQYDPSAAKWTLFGLITHILRQLPAINIKLRPVDAGSAVVYTWGAIIFSGPYIIDIDNPWCMTGYNRLAFALFRPILKYLLLQERCLAIYCLSHACRLSLGEQLGSSVFRKSKVRYPSVNRISQIISKHHYPACHGYTIDHSPEFLFIGSQFYLKGGLPILSAFEKLANSGIDAKLKMVTNYPDNLVSTNLPRGLELYRPTMSREKLIHDIMISSDVLVHPSYMESFGMSVLESLCCGLAIISSSVYALPELVVHGFNGLLIDPPLASWKGVHPTKYFHSTAMTKASISVDYSSYSEDIYRAMHILASDSQKLEHYQSNSKKLAQLRFSCNPSYYGASLGL